MDARAQSWLGTFVAPDAPLLVVAPAGMEREALTRCGAGLCLGRAAAPRARAERARRAAARIGYDGAVGVLKGGMDAWRAAGGALIVSRIVEPAVAIPNARARGYTILDVRTTDEFECADLGHVKDAVNVPAASLPGFIDELDKTVHYVVYCRCVRSDQGRCVL